MTVAEIEAAIRKLTPKELARLRKWFAKFDAEQWDRQFEEDVAKGRLEKLAKKAVKEFQHGRCLVDKCWELGRTDSPHFKKVGEYRWARIGPNFRAAAIGDKKKLIWILIGNHDEYEKIIAANQ